MSDDVIVSTGARPGTYDAMATAKPDEPVFTLQGGDPFASPTVLHWAKLAREAGLAEEREVESRRLLGKASAAEVVAWAMRDYLLGRHDEPEPEPARSTVEVVVADAADEAALLTRGVTRIHNAIAEMTELAEGLSGIAGREQARTSLLSAAQLLRQAAGDIEPRRMMRSADRG